MKKVLVTSLLMVLTLSACKTTSTNPTTAPVVGPGYANTTDQNIGASLRAARTFYRTIQCEMTGQNYQASSDQCVQDPNITVPRVLSQTEKTAFNSLGAALDIANPVYLAYHQGTATLAQAQAAADKVTPALTQAQSTIVQGVK